MMPSLETAPVLSTPDTHIFQETGHSLDVEQLPRVPDEQLHITYEIQRTVAEIRAGRWKRVALQFPDHMLLDAPRVYTALSRGLRNARKSSINHARNGAKEDGGKTPFVNGRDLSEDVKTLDMDHHKENVAETLYILADTSYGSCCVDEVAAEHADADVVVHYGRSCLSPTARLPVIYVFTKPPLDVLAVAGAFQKTYEDFQQKIIIMADIPYATYVPEIATEVRSAGYTAVYETEIIHDTASPLPNRTISNEDEANVEALREYHIFHVSDPPPSLLLTLSSRVSSVHIYPTSSDATSSPSDTIPVSSLATLRRRYALLTSITTVPIFGILVNTLSVKNYMHILSHIKKMIAAAGKKSYTFVVGKVNAAKVANFAEVGAWVVIGCWESSLFDSKDFWKPVITPFELELALQRDTERIWTGRWTSDFDAILEEAKQNEKLPQQHIETSDNENSVEVTNAEGNIETESEEESEPPEFDLRTGQYVSHSRPMGTPKARRSVVASGSVANGASSHSLIKRANGDIAAIGGVRSPAADFFHNKRSWRGLGSDIEVAYDEHGENLSKDGEGAAMEQGRSGIARGYVVEETEGKR